MKNENKVNESQIKAAEKEQIWELGFGLRVGTTRKFPENNNGYLNLSNGFLNSLCQKYTSLIRKIVSDSKEFK